MRERCLRARVGYVSPLRGEMIRIALLPLEPRPVRSEDLLHFRPEDERGPAVRALATPEQRVVLGRNRRPALRAVDVGDVRPLPIQFLDASVVSATMGFLPDVLPGPDAREKPCS